MGFRFDTKQIEYALDNLETKTDIMMKMKATEGAKIFQNYAKNNRPWTDRTGDARKRLMGWVEKKSHSIRINIEHGVYYGIYLELCNDKRYAILLPTIHKKSADVLKLFKGQIDKLGTSIGGTGTE